MFSVDCDDKFLGYEDRDSVCDQPLKECTWDGWQEIGENMTS